jgi:hypothetical protein
MTEALAPDHALQGWRDQIDENGRLRQIIEDQRNQVEDLARLNHDALFEANRYRSLYEIATDDAKYQGRVADHRGAALEALAGVATDMARQLTSFAGRCVDAANVQPPALRQQPSLPTAPAAPPVPPAPPKPPELAKSQPMAAIMPSPLAAAHPSAPRQVAGPEDGVTDLPMFLKASHAHVTPLPMVQP